MKSELDYYVDIKNLLDKLNMIDEQYKLIMSK